MLKTYPAYIFLILILTASAVDDARKGNEAFKNGDFEAAAELYKSALEQDPENISLYFNLGNALAKQGKVEDAIGQFLEYKNLAVNADDKARAEYNIGTLMAEQEQWKPAAMHLKNALRYTPGDRDAKHNYELAVSKLNNQQQQEQEQEQQQNQEPPEPSEYALAMKKQAEKLVSERKYTQAFNLMQQALKADETVAAFNAFIQRIENVSDINLQ